MEWTKSWAASAVARPVLDLAELADNPEQFEKWYDSARLERSEIDRPVTLEDVAKARVGLDIIERTLRVDG